MIAIRRSKSNFQIPYVWTTADHDARHAIEDQRNQKVLSRNVPSPWVSYIEKHLTRDFLGDLYAAEVLPVDANWALLKTHSLESAERDIINATSQRLNNGLHDRLMRFMRQGISDQGGLLYYTDRLDRCIVYEYNVGEARTAADLKSCAEIIDPDYLYDVDSALEGASDNTRAALKNAVVYGHKIVAHRNTMVHVDRRRDVGTAGPFIDTVILNEMLHTYLYESASEEFRQFGTGIRSAIEVGCGSGLLIASCAQNLPSLVKVTAVDLSMNAVHCTYSNIHANLPRGLRKLPIVCTCSLFDPEAYVGFDMVLCNPPYIPRVPKPGATSRTSAIAGTDLLESIISAVPTLTTAGGFLFMVFSSLADAEFDSAVAKAGLEVENLGPSAGFLVRFDQSEVLRDLQWVDFLAKRGLTSSPRVGLQHKLRCVAIHRKESQGLDERGCALVRHIKGLNAALDQGGRK